jgi:tetratricopeptide (TPR) repeat protein
MRSGKSLSPATPALTLTVTVALALGLSLMLGLGCALKPPAEPDVTVASREAADRLTDQGWTQLLDNRFQAAQETFKASRTGDRSYERAIRGLLICELLLGDDGRALRRLEQFGSFRPRATPENYLLRRLFNELSSLFAASTKSWIDYLDSLSRDSDLSLGERRRIQRRILLNRVRRGHTDSARRLTQQLNYVLDWSFLGPFENAAGSGHGKLAVSPAQPRDGWTFDGKSGISFKWSTPSREYAPIEGNFGLSNYFPMSTSATGYAVSTLIVPDTTECVISITHNGAIAVYLNGHQIYTHNRYSGRGEQVHVRTHLMSGANQLFVEASGLQSAASFAIGVSRPDGRPVNNLVTSADISLPAAIPDSLRTAETMPVPFFSRCREKYQRDPGNPETAFWYLISLLEFADEEETRPVLRRMQGDHTDVALVQLARALLLARIDEREKKRETWKQVAELAPTCIPARAFEISQQISQGRYAAAEELLEQIAPQAPRSIELDLLELKLASLRGRKARVKEMAELLVTAHPELPIPYLHLMRYHADLGELEWHEMYRNAWLENLPAAIAFPAQRNEALEKRDYDAALTLAKRICRLMPDSPEAWARKEFNEVVQENPRGIQGLETALASFPYSTDLLHHLAGIREALGEEPKAKRLYRRIVEIDPLDFAALNSLRSLEDKPPMEEILPLPVLGDYVPPDSVFASFEPGTDAVILADIDRRIVFDSGANLKIRYLLVKVLTDAGGNRFGRQVIEGGLGINSYDVKEARTIKPDGRRIEAQELGAVIGFQSLAPGDMIELSYTVSSFNPGALATEFWDGHFFQWNEPCLFSSYELLVPQELHFESAIHNADGDAVIYTKGTVEDFVRHTWEVRDLPEFWTEANAPPTRERALWLDISTFENWQEISDWYAALVTWPAEATSQIRETAAEVTQSSAGVMEDARRLFGFVREEIKYDDVVFGTGGVVPRRAKDVLVSQYGDCKDQCSLLSALLSARGIPASFVLTQADHGRIPYLPSPRFTHVIIAADIDGRRVYMDPTREFLPFDADYLPPEETWALPIAPETDLVSWQRDLPGSRTDSVRVVARLDRDGSLHAQVRATFRDPREIERLRAEAELLCAKDRRELFEMMVATTMPGRVITNATWDGERGESYAVSIVYSLEQSPVDFSRNGRGILRFADIGILDDNLSARVAAARRGDPLLMRDAARDVTQEFEIVLPGGMHVLDLPRDLTLSGAGVSYARSMTIEGNTLFCTRRFVIKPQRVPPQRYPLFKELIDKALLDAQRGIVLMRQ